MNLVQFGETPPGDRYESVLEPPSGPLPSIQRIKDAILTLQTDPRSVTLDTLNNIMMLRYLPEQFALLSAPIIPSCISILEQSGKHGEIIDSDAGVLALQILCFAVGVAVLVRNKYLGDFLKTLNVARARAFVSDCMEQIIKRGTQDMNHGLAAPHGLFGWDTDNAPPMACLTELGGFDKYHARFLLEHLWIHRNSTMKLFRDVFLPGWSLVVHLIWKHAEFLDEPGAETMFEQLRELVIRFSLVCTSSEDFVLHRHYLELNSVVDYPTKAGPMDRDDLVVVVACCVVKLNPPYEWLGVHNPIALDFATDLVEAIFYDIRHTQDSIELSLPLLKAGFTRLWMDLSKAPQEDVKWIDVVPFTYQLLRLTGVNFAFANDYNFRRRVTAYPVLSVILEADLIDILGRLCLMPVLLSIIPPGVETGETVSLETNQWTDLSDVITMLDTMAKLPKEYVQDQITPGFAPYQPGWLKTYCYMLELGRQLPAQHRLRRWLKISLSMWVKLGTVCGFQLPRGPCMYARCPSISMLPGAGAGYICERCCSAVYCSIRCQEADWMSAPNPHKSNCMLRASSNQLA